jgi:hypothetical protein
VLVAAPSRKGGPPGLLKLAGMAAACSRAGGWEGVGRRAGRRAGRLDQRVERRV